MEETKQYETMPRDKEIKEEEDKKKTGHSVSWDQQGSNTEHRGIVAATKVAGTKKKSSKEESRAAPTNKE